ncbi:hypothetical protein GCM10022248_01980 [Nonomuraea soli]
MVVDGGADAVVQSAAVVAGVAVKVPVAVVVGHALQVPVTVIVGHVLQVPVTVVVGHVLQVPVAVVVGLVVKPVAVVAQDTRLVMPLAATKPVIGSVHPIPMDAIVGGMNAVVGGVMGGVMSRRVVDIIRPVAREALPLGIGRDVPALVPVTGAVLIWVRTVPMSLFVAHVRIVVSQCLFGRLPVIHHHRSSRPASRGWGVAWPLADLR